MAFLVGGPEEKLVRNGMPLDLAMELVASEKNNLPVILPSDIFLNAKSAAELYLMQAKRCYYFIQAERLPNQLVFDIQHQGDKDISYNAMVLAKYLEYSCMGSYGDKQLEIKLPVQLSVVRELPDILKPESGRKQLIDYKIQEVAELAMVSLAPEFELVDFKDFSYKMECTFGIEIEFPKIRYIITADPEIISELAIRLKRDLYLDIKQ